MFILIDLRRIDGILRAGDNGFAISATGTVLQPPVYGVYGLLLSAGASVNRELYSMDQNDGYWVDGIMDDGNTIRSGINIL